MRCSNCELTIPLQSITEALSDEKKLLLEENSRLRHELSQLKSESPEEVD